MAEQVEGQIYAFSKDRKSISVSGIWLHNFVPLKEDIKKGIDYKIVYTTKKVDDKVFNNIKSIVPIKSEVQEVKPIQDTKTEIKANWEIKENRESKEKISSMMISYIKDIAVAVITNSQEYQDIDKVIENTTNQFIKSYKKIIESL